jgi:hypothetical protein
MRGHRLLVLFNNHYNFNFMDNFIKKVIEPIIIVLLIGFVIVMGAIYVAITRNIEVKQVNKSIEQKSTY